jgi:hypothetical protein
MKAPSVRTGLHHPRYLVRLQAQRHSGRERLHRVQALRAVLDGEIEAEQLVDLLVLGNRQ